MATTYIRLQTYFIFSLFVGYVAFLGVWFNIDDRAMRVQSEKDFREVLQIRNQLRDNLFKDSQAIPNSDNKLRVLRVICNDWLNGLVGEISSKRQFERQRIKDHGVPISNVSGVYILKNKRMYLNLGEHFEDRFGKDWTKDFFNALKHGGRYFSSFMSRFYNRPVSLKEFKSSTDKYETLNIRGRYYYRYYTKIKDFEVLLIIDLQKTNSSITLDHYLNSLVNNDIRLERFATDSFLWANQETVLADQTKYGLRFKPYRSGWIDFVLSKWISHILFSLLLVFLIGLGGYQILSLRLEFRVLVFFAICFVAISLVYRLQYKKLERIQSDLSLHHKMFSANELRQNLYLRYEKGIQTILRKLDKTDGLQFKMPLEGMLISANLEGQTKVIDDIGEPILLKILSEMLGRWHLIRKGYDPETISLTDHLNNRLRIDLPSMKSLVVPHIMNYVLKQASQISPGHDAQRLLNFSIFGEELILFLPGKRQFSSDVIHFLCIKRDRFIQYIASKTDWRSQKVALINQRSMQPIFQNFRPPWTKSKIEKFLVNRQMPNTLRDDTDLHWIHLSWDEMLLLVKTAKPLIRTDGPRDAVVSILFLLLGFISIFVIRTGLFNWLAQSVQILNAYRLRKQVIFFNPGWFRNEGYAFNKSVEKFIKNIDSRKMRELKMAPALDELLAQNQNLVASMAVLELVYSGLKKEDFKELIQIMSGELQRFNGFQMDAEAKFIRLCFPLEIDRNGVQNAAETGLALRQYLRRIANCEFYSIIRTGSFEIKFDNEDGLHHPILMIKDLEVQKRPDRYSSNELMIDDRSYQALLDLYDLEPIAENYYHFMSESLEG